MKKKLYVGCSLAHASQDLKKLVPEFKKQLSTADNNILEFVGEVAGTEADVYKTDIGQVQACDYLIAFVDEPSIGLGMELNEAIRLKKPILCLYTEGKYLSRMLRGAADLGFLRLKTFTSLDDAVKTTSDFLTIR